MQRSLAGNQVYTLCAMMAHNLAREIQMLAKPPLLRARPKRPAAWRSQTLDTLRHRFIQRAGRLIRPQGQLTLTMSANPAVRKDLLHFLEAVEKVAYNQNRRKPDFYATLGLILHPSTDQTEILQLHLISLFAS